MIAVIAQIPIKPEKMDQAVDMFKTLLAQVNQEEGTLVYTLNVSKKAPNTLVVVERYKDKAALGVHSSTPHFKAFSEKLPDVLAGKPDISIYDEIGAIDVKEV